MKCWSESVMKINLEEVLKKDDIIIYSKEDALSMLYEKLPTVSEYISKRNSLRRDKYVNLALKYGYNNYRIGSVADIYEYHLFHSFSKMFRDFLNRSGVFLVVFNCLSGKPVSAVFRRLDQKEFMDFSIYPCIYGLDLIDENFKFGDYLILAEGMYDADSFRHLYKNTIAVLTSSLTVMSAEVVCTLTDKFILAYDSDSAGDSGRKNSTEKILRVNSRATIEILNIYSGDKDLGIMEEAYLAGDTDGYRMREDYYSTILKTVIDDSKI
jgi:hypothetical protein